METSLIVSALAVLALAVGVALLFHRLRVPSIVGFLVTGALVGPHGLGLIREPGDVRILSEIGVALLLFTVGIEFSLEKLLAARRVVLVGGVLQVAVTGGVGTLLALAAGAPPPAAIFWGFLLALSSTAIVLRVLDSRGELDSVHGRGVFGVLILQDLAVVPMMLLSHLLVGTGRGSAGELLLSLTLGGAIVTLVVLGARRLVPRLLLAVTRTRDREVFLLSILVLVLLVAGAAAQAGLSLALGAFLAGLVLSESEYGHAALAHMLPFRDVFLSFFFISAGMLLDLGFLTANPGRVLFAAGGVIVGKAALATAAVLFAGLPLRSAALAGLALAQVGEFSFVLADSGRASGLLSAHGFDLFMAISVLTMAAAPFVINGAPALADLLVRSAGGRGRGPDESAGSAVAELRDHLVIVGFGLNGRNLTLAAERGAIPHVILEVDPDTVRDERAAGRPILYGDATQETVLEHAGIGRARVAVIAISDPTATRRVVAIARRLNPALQLIARTRYVQEMAPLVDLGADEVVPEEFETSLEISARVLRRFLVPEPEIEQLAAELRASNYRMLLSPDVPDAPAGRPLPSDSTIRTLRLAPNSQLAGRTLREADLRRVWGITVLAVRRGGSLRSNPDPDMALSAGDVLMVLGPLDRLEALAAACSARD